MLEAKLAYAALPRVTAKLLGALGYTSVSRWVLAS